MASVVAEPSALAATSGPAASAPTPTDPLLGTTDLRSDGLNARTLEALDTEAEATGEASAIIALPMSFTPEALLTADESAQQRAEIIRRQDALIADLESLGAVSTRRYATTPYVATSLPRSALTALSSLTSAGEVTVDQVAEITLAESTVRVQSAMAVGHGFNGAGTTVAVIDTGVDPNHPFLGSKVVSEACYSQGGDCPGGSTQLTGPGAGVPCTIPALSCRHGTHVAGIVAGRRTAGASFDGVAPSATIISINVFSWCGSDCLTTSTSEMISALEHVYELRDTFSIAAVNMSIGTTETYSSACDADPLKTGIDNLRAVGIPTVIASGNTSSGTGISSPGCISTAVTVGSTNDAPPVDEVSPFSNSASFLDLLAPGASIRSSVPGGGYANWNGTSMAAPHVAGAWALLKQQNPSLTVEDGELQLQSTGLPVTDSRNGVTKGRIRVLEALGFPGTPRNVSATASVRAASVSFSAPTNTGSAPVSEYVVTASPGGAQVSGSSSPLTVTALADDTSYTFSVAARNAAGIGPGSEASAAVTTHRLPGAPTDVAAAAGYEGATVSFAAPADNGGSPVTTYVANASPGGATGSASSSPVAVGGLSPSTAYTFTVRAVTAVGQGPVSPASDAVAPLARTVPGAPTNVMAEAINGSQARVAWTEPADDGGWGIDTYELTAWPGELTRMAVDSGWDFPGLTPGVAYTFTVSAQNNIGWGPTSAHSPPTRLPTLPGAPRNVTATPGEGSAVISFDPPQDDGGSPVTSYSVYASPGGFVETGAASPLTVANLDPLKTYSFTVVAQNTEGAGPAGASAEIIPLAKSGTGGPTLSVPGVKDGGYWMVSGSGSVFAFGGAAAAGDGGVAAVDIEPTPSQQGYWVLSRDGFVHARGDAPYLGAGKPIVECSTATDPTCGRPDLAPGEEAASLSVTPSGRGYWIFTNRGRVITVGDAPFFGDVSGLKLNGPVLGSVTTPSGRGYWMVASDGGIFSFGDATFFGSMGGTRLNKPVISMAPDPDGAGYWLVASDGGIFAFDAAFYGSLGSTRLNKPISGIVGGSAGYLMAGEDGGIFAFGDVPFHGSLGTAPPPSPIVAVALKR